MDQKEKQLMMYHNLRYRLAGHVVKENDDHNRLMATARSKQLTAVELHAEDFSKICDHFDRKGLLGPNNLDILKEIFPQEKNEKAYNDIVQTEKKISELSQSSSVGKKRPPASGVDQFAKELSPSSSVAKKRPPASGVDQFAKDVAGKPFHKTSENVFYYNDAKPYFKADIDASIGLIKINREHGTCFRIGDKYIMTAYHVVKNHMSNLIQECQIFFGDETQPFKIKSASFREKEYDLAIFEVDDNEQLPPSLTLDRDDPSPYVDIFGYPGEQILQVDMRCPICNNLEVKVKEAVSYWKKTYPDDPQNSTFDKEFEILKHRTPLHSSKTFENGASGGPITRLDNGRPVVTMMYQGGTPLFYYEKYRGETHPMNYRIEYGVSMKTVYDILGNECQILLRDNIFSVRS